MAIAFDATTGAHALTATSLTIAHTTAGSNRALIVGVACYNGGAAADIVTGVTYNGVAMTQLAKFGPADVNIEMYIYGLLNPTSGTNNIVISASASCNLYAENVSYTGVQRSGLPDASKTQGATASPDTTTLTTIADNSWTVLFARASGASLAASTGSTLRHITDGDNGIFDSNGAITPAGSHSMTFTGAAGNCYSIMISLAPFIASAAGASTLSMMGVG